jgi:hypothetical protein
MTAMNAKEFVIDYCQRHAHPANAILHIVGVPAVIFGIYELFTGHPCLGACNFVFGYFLQYLGHRVQGNEVGEVTLIKAVIRSIRQRAGKNNA